MFRDLISAPDIYGLDTFEIENAVSLLAMLTLLPTLHFVTLPYKNGNSLLLYVSSYDNCGIWSGYFRKTSHNSSLMLQHV